MFTYTMSKPTVPALLQGSAGKVSEQNREPRSGGKRNICQHEDKSVQITAEVKAAKKSPSCQQGIMGIARPDYEDSSQREKMGGKQRAWI